MFMTRHSLEANAIQLNLVGKRKRPPKCGHHDGLGGVDVKVPITEPVSGLLGSMLEVSLSCCTMVSNTADGSVICELVTRNVASRDLSIEKNPLPKPFSVNHFLYDDADLCGLQNALVNQDWSSNSVSSY